MSGESVETTHAVVVGVDGSAPSMAAARWAAEWAEGQGQKVILVRVVPTMPVPTRTGALRAMREDGDFVARILEQTRRHLDEAVAELRDQHPGLVIEGAVAPGHAVELLAARSGSALLVLGATGASGLSGVLLGGTVAGVLHHAKGTVVVVPETPEGAVAAAGIADGPVVVGLDGSEHSPRIAREAIAAAATLGRRLIVGYAWDLDPTRAYGAMAILAQDEAAIEADARRWLSEVTAPAAEAGVAVEHVVRWGRPAFVLGELAVGAALLVVGSRGYGGFPGLLLGSVSRGLTQRPACPVMVVRI